LCGKEEAHVRIITRHPEIEDDYDGVIEQHGINQREGKRKNKTENKFQKREIHEKEGIPTPGDL